MNAVTIILLPASIVEWVVSKTDLIDAVDLARRCPGSAITVIAGVHKVVVDCLQTGLDHWADDNAVACLDASDSGFETIVQQLIHEAWTEIERREQVEEDELADARAAGDIVDWQGNIIRNNNWLKAW